MEWNDLLNLTPTDNTGFLQVYRPTLNSIILTQKLIYKFLGFKHVFRAQKFKINLIIINCRNTIIEIIVLYY